MIRPRVTVLELMALVLFAGIIFGAVPLFESTRIEEGDIGLGIYLAVLVIATLAARSGRAGATFWRGVAAFGWAYLALALHFGLGFDGDSDSLLRLARRCLVAGPMGALCGIASWYFADGEPGPSRRGDVDSPAPPA